MKCEKCGMELKSLMISVFNHEGIDYPQELPFMEAEEDAVVMETTQNWTGYGLSEEEQMDDIHCPVCGMFPFNHRAVQVYDVVRIVCFKTEAPTEKEERWIPVTEQLPKTDGRFMVTIKGKSGKPHVEMRNFHAGSQKWESNLGWNEENVLAWQARPRPYGWKPKEDAR